MNTASTDALIAQIYSAASGRQSWQPALDAIALECDAWATQLLAIDRRSGAALFSHTGGSAKPQDHLAYLRTYQHIDPRAKLVVALDRQDWLHCHDIISDEQVAASPFYQNFLIPVGGRYMSAVPIVNDDDIGVLLSILRGVGKQPLDAVSLQWLDRLRPHLAEAMAIYRHLTELHMKSTAGQAILDRLTHSVLLVDASSTLRYANAAGLQTLASENVLRVSSGRVIAVDPRDDFAYGNELNSMAVAAPHIGAPERRFVRLRGTDAHQRFGLSLSALRPSETGGAFGPLPLAMIVLHDASSIVECDPFILQEMFDLTPAEADVGVLLSQGASAEDIARHRGVALSTVRSQLRTLMDKTGTKRQGDLVRTLLTLPHGLGGL